MRVYLCGYMSEKCLDECLGWRKKIVTHYNNWKGKEKYPICWLDPFNGEIAHNMSGGGLKADIPANTILHRDYAVIQRADLIVANMSTFGQDRPPIGTICELAWAWQQHKPIIMITDQEWYREHPFMKNFTSWVVGSVEELLEKKVINHIFKGFNDVALYNIEEK